MRNRVVTPGFWSDEKISAISIPARLVYAGLWSCSDDYGVSKGHPAWLKSQIFPYDDISSSQFEAWLVELDNIKRIRFFYIDSELYLYIPTFKVHQRIDRPSKHRNPQPPENIMSAEFDDHFRRRLDECSSNTRRGLGDEVKLSKKRISLESTSVDSNSFSSQQRREENASPSRGLDEDSTSVPEDKPSKHPPCPYDELVAIYHTALPAAPRIQVLGEKGRQHLRNRWRESPERQSLEWWQGFFRQVAESRFLTGRVKDWMADLLWLVKPENFVNVLNGRYGNKPGAGLPARTRRNVAAVDAVKRMIGGAK